MEPNALVSVAFNKAVDPSSLSGKLTVLRNGAPLGGGYLLAPGGQVITFSAKDALPEGETLTVKASGLFAQTGPGLASDLASRFTVRWPLTLVRGVVTDDGMQPLSGVKVELVGTPFSTTMGSDGNWAIFGVPEGAAVVGYTGGTTSDGRSLPQVKRKVYVTAEKTTRERVVALTPKDKSSAQYVNGSQASTLSFQGVHGALAVNVPANGFAFPTGAMSGFVTATRLRRARCRCRWRRGCRRRCCGRWARRGRG